MSDEYARRDWMDLRGLTINEISTTGDFVRLHFSDETYLDIGADDAFDEGGMRLTGAGDLPEVAA